MFIWSVLLSSVLFMDRRLRLVEVLLHSKIKMPRLVALLPSPGGYRGPKFMVAKVPSCRDFAGHKAGGSGTDLHYIGRGWHRHRGSTVQFTERAVEHRHPIAGLWGSHADRSRYANRSETSQGSGSGGWPADSYSACGYCDRSRRQDR